MVGAIRRLPLMPQSLALAMAQFAGSPVQEARSTIQGRRAAQLSSTAPLNFSAAEVVGRTQMAIPNPDVRAEMAGVVLANMAGVIRTVELALPAKMAVREIRAARVVVAGLIRSAATVSWAGQLLIATVAKAETV